MNQEEVKVFANLLDQGLTAEEKRAQRLKRSGYQTMTGKGSGVHNRINLKTQGEYSIYGEGEKAQILSKKQGYTTPRSRIVNKDIAEELKVGKGKSEIRNKRTGKVSYKKYNNYTGDLLEQSTERRAWENKDREQSKSRIQQQRYEAQKRSQATPTPKPTSQTLPTTTTPTTPVVSKPTTLSVPSTPSGPSAASSAAQNTAKSKGRGILKTATEFAKRNKVALGIGAGVTAAGLGTAAYLKNKKKKKDQES